MRALPSKDLLPFYMAEGDLNVLDTLQATYMHLLHFILFYSLAESHESAPLHFLCFYSHFNGALLH